ncbi:MAG: F0F1 ATP synthase subunit alpha, partial [Polyangiaceae bacterium]
ISVSRVGGNAQIKAMKSVAGTLKLDLAQYREKAAFSQFASDLDKVTRDMLERGVRLVEILKQGQYQPLPVEKQIVIIYAGTKGYLDELPTGQLGAYEKGLIQFLTAKHPKILENLREKKVLDKEIEEELKKALGEYKTAFGKGETK